MTKIVAAPKQKHEAVCHSLSCSPAAVDRVAGGDRYDAEDAEED